MLPKTLLLNSLLLALVAPTLQAGDAIAIGYNGSGVWTAVTFNRSSTPKGGLHYHDSTEACARAMRDLQLRAGEDIARMQILGQSNRTGFVTVARARSTKISSEGPLDVTAIGRGKSQIEADRNAFQKLTNSQGTIDQKIVYQYFSYGSDSVPPARHHRS